MMRRNCYIIFFTCLLGANKLKAQQDLTGTWEGIMGKQIFPRDDGQLLQINIVQQNDKLCGYTFDSVINHKGDHCKALFEGVYDKRWDIWTLTGTSFIENSGDHVLMYIKLWVERRGHKDKIDAEVSLKSAPDPFLESRDIFNPFGFMENVLRSSPTETVQLKRISGNPPPMPANIPSCFTLSQKIKDSANNATIALKPLPLKVADTLRTRTDPIKNIVHAAPVVVQNDTLEAIQKMTGRKNVVFTHVPVTVKNITLKVYDNAIVDGDTVTIFYNGRLLVSKQLISEKPIVINIELDEKESRHEIILYAENLGSIPPNTALIVVTAGDKRYELHASASLEENAVLVFDYTPK